MNNNLERDEYRINRLSSFLYWEGNLQAKKVQPIKRNVYYIESDEGDTYILKGHSNISNLRQQWEFFEKIHSKRIVSFTRYPNGKKEISAGTNSSWTISPYIRGRKLNYQSPVDRMRAVSTIKNFHQLADGIQVNHYIRKQLFFNRWDSRLTKFLATEDIFLKYRFASLYNDIITMMKKYINIVASFSWEEDQLLAERYGQWVHGDVASHNFIFNEKTYMIDFDLLHCTSPLYDFIQLGQRFLPNIDWKVDALINYNMVEETEMERFLLSVFIPSDILREWLYFLTKKGNLNIKAYLKNMEQEWIKRREFLQDSTLLLR